MMSSAGEGMRCFNILWFSGSINAMGLIPARCLLSCGRTRRMTCCPRGGMLVLRRIWRWGWFKVLDFILYAPTSLQLASQWLCGSLTLSLCSPLQENKQSPLLSIEEIQNGIQSQDGYKQLQVKPHWLYYLCELLWFARFFIKNFL